MKVQKKHYWKGLEQLSNDPEFVKNAEKEFPEYLPINRNEEGGSSRRDFLKMMGFSIAAASLAACEAPVRKAIPYVNQPVDVNPGIPNYYASTYIHKGDYASIVVKTREGRPIKVEGNELSTVTGGGVNAQIEASILNLYDSQRLKSPISSGAETSWEELDSEITSKLVAISSRGGQIRIVSPSIISPTAQRAVRQFLNKYPTAQHIVYDARSVYGLTLANQRTFGRAVVPSYDFSKQDVVVSFGADFLGTWISPIEFARQYSQTRKLGQGKKDMSRHYQFEALFSLTGANADYRTRIKPSQEGLVIAKLYNLIAAKAGAASINTNDPGEIAFLQKAADELWSKRGRSLVVAGSNDANIQQLVNNINQLLGAYEANIIDLNTPLYTRQGNDEAMTRFIQDADEGRIEGVIFWGCNPVYDHPLGSKLAASLPEMALTVSTSDRLDETASLAAYGAPDHHYLESWNDAEPKRGRLSLMQPAITPLFNTRQAEESLLKWAGEGQDYYTYLRNNWRDTYFSRQTQFADFDAFWDNTLLNGVLDIQDNAAQPLSFSINLSQVTSGINSRYKANNEARELIFYEKIGIGTGSMANNPWLQEMPDPISRVCWDNYITIPQDYARELGITISEGKTKLMEVVIGDKKFKIPVLVQPGQASGTLGIALGYGRRNVGPVGNGVGVDVFPFVPLIGQTLDYALFDGVQVSLTSERYTLPQTQTHHTYMGRETIIQESTLPEYQENPMAGRYTPTMHTSEGDKPADEISLWDGHAYPNHHWGMMIDLNSCIGCGACTIACQVENNVPVVGREEVMNRREMHWLRIDRYYSSEEPDDYDGLEKAAENPEVVFQPMLCQHCNNAPCETVCPVAATTHSSEGLNQMAYNRCIGTRYCANNCPYKVRRFNWFKYFDNKQFKDTNVAMYDDLGKMVLNPDVTVRSRGVMEKCTFCVQRIQLGKLEAKKERRPVKDGEIVTACAKACPTDAIVFGDMNDANSRVAKGLGIERTRDEKGVKATEPRAYNVLMEINVRPNIFYLTKIKNKDKNQSEA